MDAEITTISKTVVILGNEMIRNISLGLAFVDMFQKHHPDVNLKKIVANAFIAATIAMKAAAKLKNANPEEAFINSLMYNIGPISIAYYMPEKYNEIQRLS